MAVKAYLFDMDGTLIDSMPALTELAVDVICQHYDVPRYWAKEAYKRTVGVPFGKQLELIFGALNVNVEAEREYLVDKFAPTLTAPIIQSTYEELVRARKSKYKTGIVSSTTEDLVKQVCKNKFLDMFDWVSGVTSPERTKRHQIREFLQELKLFPSQVLYFGDSREDKEIAYLFGMKFADITLA